ncbi:hypothetical protein KV223_004312 [Escherichia coli]|nr:hypothetical protein [Escherichia coli]EHH4912851.1 hypothetical protein [Escherichia coli]EHS3113897.1 hypothetical protein [Escherichia coli]EHS3150970.1 hypothetical protein [Escherichia coli]EHS3234833.1 hypothetical protein [Escherichia coli]
MVSFCDHYKWGSNPGEFPNEKSLAANQFTQRIERNNLPLRIRIKRLVRRTICFSRSPDERPKNTEEQTFLRY